MAPEEAEEAAYRMEHSIPRTILDRLIRFVEFTDSCPFSRTRWLEGVGYQCRHGHDRAQCARCMTEHLDKAVAPADG